MKCLAVDTSGSHLLVSLINNDEIISDFKLDISLKHSETLMPTIENVLTKAGVNISDVDVFACVIGPGSFTGIRIGVSAVKAFSYANNKKVLSITSFDVLAYNKETGKNVCVIDAKHDNFYAQLFDGTKSISEPMFITKAELVKYSKEYNILTSSDIEICKSNCDLQLGFNNAIKSKLNEATIDREQILPLYVRKSQAEENK